MTVNKLLKLLQAAVDEGHGRCPVCIDKPTFTHPLEPDGACILDISGLRSESVPMMNDDGGMGHGPHDRERYRFSIVLHGASYSSRGEGQATDPEWGNNQTGNPKEPDAVAFLETTVYGHDQGRIVSSNDLTQHQISEAQASGRWFVAPSGLGWALLPWHLTTDKDRAREIKSHDIAVAEVRERVERE